ncbi:hypothetical protein [Actinophytocola xinjiangensis]|nr:hypothetical protein [Actinophytocola xinjiangensis]
MLAVVVLVLAVAMIGPLLLERLERRVAPGPHGTPPSRDVSG